MKKFIYNKLIYFLMMILPILDIISSFITTKLNFKITATLVIEILLLILELIYLIVLDKKKLFNYIYIGIIIIFNILNIYFNQNVLINYWFDYFNNLLKFDYYLITIIFFVKLFKDHNYKITSLRYPILILGISYFISAFTSTYFNTYETVRYGMNNYYSNYLEYGNILGILFPISIYNAFINKDGNKFDIFGVIALGLSLLLHGTRVGLFIYVVSVITYFIYRLIHNRKIDYRLIICILLILFPIVLFKELPLYKNLELDYPENQINYVLMSGNDNALRNINTKYKEYSLIEKIVGKTSLNIGTQAGITLIEYDILDIFYNFGILGLVLLLSTYLFIIINLFVNKKNYNIYVLMGSIILIIISILDGNSILNVTCSTYLLLILSNIITYKKDLDNRKTILLTKKNKYISKLDKNEYKLVFVEDLYPKCNNIKIEVINLLLSYFLTTNATYDYVVTNKEKDCSFRAYYLQFAYTNDRIDYRFIDHLGGKNNEKNSN